MDLPDTYAFSPDTHSLHIPILCVSGYRDHRDWSRVSDTRINGARHTYHEELIRT
ncbi:hypothetical protein K474DRAFT_1664678 [Panus rudis PR-1116 ss-1]|nr:hypothetical protein K474DRAFT_1664678 [Panus rudis PR-1116 ss-1]